MGLLEFFTGDQPPLIKRALQDVCDVLDRGQEMFGAASAHLLDNEILDTDLELLAAEIKLRGRTCRHAVLEHLNVDPKREMVLTLKILTVVQEAIRIADLAMGMWRTANEAHRPRMGSIVETLRGLRNRTLLLFEQTRDCFVAGDPVMAKNVSEEGMAIQQATAECLRRVMAQTQDAANEGAVYALAAHTISNVSLHLGVIVSTVLVPFHKIGE